MSLTRFRLDTPGSRIARVRHVADWTRQYAEQRGMHPACAATLAHLAAAMVRGGMSPARAYQRSTEIVKACIPAPLDLAEAA